MSEVLRDYSKLKSTSTVAIIGASYAGLTLANFLKKHSISFIIFESSPTYYDDDDDDDDSNNNSPKLKSNLFVIGPFILPSLKRIAKELSIKNVYTSAGVSTTEQNDNCYERSDVILTLLQNVKDSIQFSTCINSITCFKEENKQPSYFCNASETNKSSDISTCTTGPFEYIIAADGVHSIIGSNYKSSNDTRILLIGDARWVNDSWYDFGFHRTTEGADVAINDGLELGKILKSLIIPEVPFNGNDDNDGLDGGRSKEVILRLKKYSAYEKYKLRKKKTIFRRFIFMVFVAYIIGKFRKGILQ